MGNSSSDRSQELRALAETVLPGGVNSPVRAFKSVGGTPRFIDSGEGAFLNDVDGNRYLDFCCSWGPLILGHADSDIVDAVTKQVKRGMTYGATTEHEYNLAQFIVDHVDPVQKIRFVSSGTEAVMSAIRLARGYTGRDLIVKFEGCYHGHSDHLLVKAGSGLVTFGQPSSAGVPKAMTENTIVMPLDDENALIDLFEKRGDEIAAVVIEGIPANNGLLKQRHEYIQHLRNITEKHGTLLVFDEVITGFRLGFGGAAEYYGITPDLLTYGKIIGGGMPVGAFGGRADIMNQLSPEGPVYQAGTLSGNPVAMVAGLATLQKLADGSIYRRLEQQTSQFALRLEKHLGDRSDSDIAARVPHISSIFWILFQGGTPRAADGIEISGIEYYNRLHSSVLDAGIYLPPSGYEVCFVSAAHTEQMLTEAADQLAEIFGGSTTRP